MWADMLNAGQNCAGIERVYVEKSVAARFIQNVCEVAGRLRLGEDVGPLCTPAQLAIVEKHVEAAQAAGAKVEVGGERGDGDGYWFKPPVLTQVGADLEIMVDETCGRVLPIRGAEAVHAAATRTHDGRRGARRPRRQAMRATCVSESARMPCVAQSGSHPTDEWQSPWSAAASASHPPVLRDVEATGRKGRPPAVPEPRPSSPAGGQQENQEPRRPCDGELLNTMDGLSNSR